MCLYIQKARLQNQSQIGPRLAVAVFASLLICLKLSFCQHQHRSLLPSPQSFIEKEWQMLAEVALRCDCKLKPFNWAITATIDPFQLLGSQTYLMQKVGTYFRMQLWKSLKSYKSFVQVNGDEVLSTQARGEKCYDQYASVWQFTYMMLGNHINIQHVSVFLDFPVEKDVHLCSIIHNKANSKYAYISQLWYVGECMLWQKLGPAEALGWDDCCH